MTVLLPLHRSHGLPPAEDSMRATCGAPPLCRQRPDDTSPLPLRLCLLPRRPLPAAADGTPRTEGTMMIHMDPHIPYIPAFLLNFVLGVLAP